MKDMFFFERMVTPKIITFIYWVMLLLVAVGALGYLFAGPGGFITRFFLGLLGAIGGAIGVRIWCELLIVLFKMNEALQEMRQK
jgi:hypothetical protein